MVAALPFIALAATAGGDILGGLSAAGAANYNAQVAGNNATMARYNAIHAAQATAAQTEAEGLKARSRLAGVRAGQAASGVEVNTGSAADVQTSQRLLGKLDTATVASRGAEAVYGYEAQATGFSAERRLQLAQVGPDIFGGVLKATRAVAQAIPDLPSKSGGGLDPSGLGSGNAEATGLEQSYNTSIIGNASSLPGPYAWMGGNPTDQYEFGDF